MKRSTIAAIGAGATAAVVALSTVQGPAGASGSTGKPRSGTAIGLTATGSLVAFDLRLRERPRTIGTVRGLAGDTRLVGIDYRIQDRALYGVGNAGGVYTLSTVTARATKVNVLSVPLSGASFGVDFNPAADRLRIVSDTGQNLRHNVNTGGTTLVDGTLTAPPATATSLGVTAAAYTNNDLAADTATTLFDIDTTLDQVALQSPANSGQLAGTGKLGVDAGTDAGFDVVSTLDDGAAVANSGYATLSVNGSYRLYSVSVLTGAVESRGSFPARAQVSDLAVVPGR